MSKKTTKRALAMSFVSVFLCVCMLVGTTFAWFTDSVTSSNNVIKSGTLDVEMSWADGKTDPANTTWKDASQGAIFNYDKWEPGYVEAKHVKVANVGTLDFKYKLGIVPTGEVSKLADVIDVYFVDGAQAVTRESIAAATPVGTLAQMIADPDGAAYGTLEATKEKVVTIALKMRESATNEYQNLSIGSNFAVQLLAAQVEAEFDSFDNTYDKFADYDGEISTAAALVAAFTEGGTYKVLSDIIVDDYAEIPAGKTVNLDLAGKTISKSVDDGLIVRNYGALTLAGNGTIDGTIGNYAIRNEAGSSLTVEEGVVVDGGFGAISCFGGTITINGGDFSNEESNTTHYVVYATNNSTVTINGGTFTFADDQYAGANGSPILAATNGSTIEINGGTFEATGGSALCYNANNIVIKGGTFMNRAYNTYGGNIEGKVATGYKAVENNGVYLVLPANVVAVVSDTGELTDAIKNAPTATTDNIIYLTDVTYSGDIDITVAAMGQGGDVVIKAMDGTNPVIAGTVTLGYRNQGVGATMYNANVTFEGITFDHAEAAKHSLEIQDVKSLTLKNCTIIGDGEYGIGCARGNGTGTSKIVGCTFENAGMQLLGNFATGLVIDQCTFNESCINVQAGNGVTVQNCEFNNTLTSANVGESFYLVRSNSTPITVKNCEINIDSELTDVATGQAKWGVMWNRGSTNWTVENVAVTTTSAAQAQTELLITKCTSTGVINTANLTVNGVAQ